MSFSKRTDWELAQNKFAQILGALKEKGVPVLDLTVSNPTCCGFEYLNTELLKPFLDPKNLVYEPDPQGLPAARQSVSEYYQSKGIFVDPRDIFLTAGTSEAYSFVFRLLCNPGDEVAAPQPSYPLLDYLANLSDISLKRYSLSYREHWRIGPDAWAHAPEHPKAAMVVHPNNPTGNYIQTNERDLLVQFCDSRSCALIADEVFLDFPVGENAQAAPSFAAEQNVLTFTLSGISKILGLPQMKLSWIVVSGPEKIRRVAKQKLEIISDTFLSMNTPAQNALPHWMNHREKMTGEISNRLKQNLRYLKQQIPPEGPFRFLNTEGGWSAVLELPPVRTDEEWSLTFLEQDHVAIHPGYLFDFESGPHLVLSLLTPEKTFQEGIQKIKKRAIL